MTEEVEMMIGKWSQVRTYFKLVYTMLEYLERTGRILLSHDETDFLKF